MQQATAAPPVPPAPPTPAVVGLPAQGPLRPLTSREVDAIRDRRSDISNQLTSAMDRRENLIEEMQDAPVAAQPGLLSQIQLLDGRIIAIERDMEESGRMLRTGLTVDNGTLLVAPSSSAFSRANQETIQIMGITFGFFVLLPIAIVFVRRMWVRGRRGAETAGNAQQDARMERLEQAVDAIAIEIERVGESQRFQQKVLAEANMMPAMSPAHRDPVRVPDYESSRSRDR